MTKMSAAALPPRQPPINEKDRAHPRFNEYMAYRGGMSRLLVEACNFENWLLAQEREAAMAVWDRHPRLEEFRAWMWATKAGARKMPGPGPNCFPHNFKFWLEGGRG